MLLVAHGEVECDSRIILQKKITKWGGCLPGVV